MKQVPPNPPPNKSVPPPISRLPHRCKIRTMQISQRPSPHARRENTSLRAKSARKSPQHWRIARKTRRWHPLSLRRIRRFMAHNSLISILGLLSIPKAAQASSITITITQAVVNKPTNSQLLWLIQHLPQLFCSKPLKYSKNADKDKVWLILTQVPVASIWEISFSIIRRLARHRISHIHPLARGPTLKLAKVKQFWACFQRVHSPTIFAINHLTVVIQPWAKPLHHP